MPGLIETAKGCNYSHVLEKNHIQVVKQFCFEHRGELVNPRIYSQWAISKNMPRLIGVQLLSIFISLNLEQKTNPEWVAPRMFLVPEDFPEPKKRKVKEYKYGAWRQAARERWIRYKENSSHLEDQKYLRPSKNSA